VEGKKKIRVIYRKGRELLGLCKEWGKRGNPSTKRGGMDLSGEKKKVQNRAKKKSSLSVKGEGGISEKKKTSSWEREKSQKRKKVPKSRKKKNHDRAAKGT